MSSPWVQARTGKIQVGDTVKFKPDQIPSKRFTEAIVNGHPNRFTVVRVYSYTSRGRKFVDLSNNDLPDGCSKGGWFMDRFELVDH
jgi:hypothetical protein